MIFFKGYYPNINIYKIEFLKEIPDSEVNKNKDELENEKDVRINNNGLADKIISNNYTFNFFEGEFNNGSYRNIIIYYFVFIRFETDLNTFTYIYKGPALTLYH